MKVILCTGGPNSGHEHIFDVLVKAGVSRAQPASPKDFQPQTLHAEMLQSHEVSLDGTGPLTQVLPGKLWSQLASRLFLANIGHPVWGWADHQTTVWMDFWQEFDPQVRIVLAYQTPQAHLAEVLDQETEPTAQGIATELDQWIRWNSTLLRYCHRHPARCALVNSEQAMAKPQELVTALASKWKIADLNPTDVVCGAKHAYPNLQFQLISQLIDSQHPALALCQELDGTAVLPSEQSSEGLEGGNPIAAWADWVGMRALLDGIAKKYSDLMDGREAAKRTVAQLDAQLAHVTQAANAAVDIRHENELLRLQLDQVENELEHYFLRCQELEHQRSGRFAGHETDKWLVHQPPEIRVDLRQLEVVGSNWYHAESDGRWAGPAMASSLQMPPLQAGNYTLVLHVVDAMHFDIVQSMLIEALGQSIPFEIQSLSQDADYPLLCKAQMSMAHEEASMPWRINLRFPQVVCPAESGADDHRRLAIRLQSLTLTQHT